MALVLSPEIGRRGEGMAFVDLGQDAEGPSSNIKEEVRAGAEMGWGGAGGEW